MNHRIAAAAVLAAALALPQVAGAQVVSLAPPDPAVWDTAFHVGWLGGNKSPVAPDWNDWYDAAAFGASAGYYLTPNVKLEAEAWTSTSGAILHDNVIYFPGNLYPYYRQREHRFRATQVAVGLHYQFFENRWFHPFAGAGLAVTHETERAEAITPDLYRLPPPPGPLPPLAAVRDDRTAVNPFLGVGFKAYVSERAFVRSDVRATFSADRAEWVVWRGGIGFDF